MKGIQPNQELKYNAGNGANSSVSSFASAPSPTSSSHHSSSGTGRGYMTNTTPALDRQSAESSYLSDCKKGVLYSDIIKESKSGRFTQNEEIEPKNTSYNNYNGDDQYDYYQNQYLRDNIIKKKASGLLKNLRKV